MREHREYSVMHLVLTQAYCVHMSCLCGIPEPGLRVQEWRKEKWPSEEISFGSSLLLGISDPHMLLTAIARTQILLSPICFPLRA